jgi:hypothetical protein
MQWWYIWAAGCRRSHDMEAREKGRLSPKELTLDDGDTAYTLERVVKAEEEDVTEAGMEERPARGNRRRSPK